MSNAVQSALIASLSAAAAVGLSLILESSVVEMFHQFANMMVVPK